MNYLPRSAGLDTPDEARIRAALLKVIGPVPADAIVCYHRLAVRDLLARVRELEEVEQQARSSRVGDDCDPFLEAVTEEISPEEVMQRSPSLWRRLRYSLGFKA